MNIKIRFNIADVLFILSMTFVLAIPGPSMMKAVSIIAFFGYMMLLKIFKNKKIYNNLHIVWLFSFLILAYLSRYWALSPEAVYEQIVNVLWTVLLSIAVAAYVMCYNLNAQKIANRIFIIAIIFIINTLLNGTFADGRLSVGINENTFGRIASGMTCFLFWKCKKERWKNVLFDIVTIILMIITFFSGSRTALLILCIYIVAIMFFEYPSKNVIKYLGKALLILIVCCIGYILLTNIEVLYNSIGYRIEMFLGTMIGNEVGDGSMITRQNMMQYAKNIFSEYPWFGIGLNNFKYATYFGTYAHNNFYELAACLGIIGLVVYYVPLFIYFIRIVKLWNINALESILPVGIIIAFLLGDIGGVSYFNPIIHVFVAVAIGMICNISKSGGKYDKFVENNY